MKRTKTTDCEWSKRMSHTKKQPETMNNRNVNTSPTAATSLRQDQVSPSSPPPPLLAPRPDPYPFRMGCFPSPHTPYPNLALALSTSASSRPPCRSFHAYSSSTFWAITFHRRTTASTSPTIAALPCASAIDGSACIRWEALCKAREVRRRTDDSSKMWLMRGTATSLVRNALDRWNRSAKISRRRRR